MLSYIYVMFVSIHHSITTHIHTQLNDDIHGGIEMLSQTGPFTIPVACLTKKCLISADRLVVDFGRVCVGETVRRKVTLTNSGSLPTNFKFESKPQLLQPSSNVSHILSVFVQYI